jgi:hypothetical protein
MYVHISPSIPAAAFIVFSMRTGFHESKKKSVRPEKTPKQGVGDGEGCTSTSRRF